MYTLPMPKTEWVIFIYPYPIQTWVWIRMWDLSKLSFGLPIAGFVHFVIFLSLHCSLVCVVETLHMITPFYLGLSICVTYLDPPLVDLQV
jgi:hypothetical protein